MDTKYEVIELSDTNKKIKIDDKIIMYLYGLYFILKPFYFWSSGLPQIADFLMVFVIVLFIWTKREYSINLNNKPLIISTFTFTFYSVVVNLIWSMILSTTEMFAPSLYLIYNCSILILSSIMVQLYKNRMLKTIYYSATYSLMIQFGLYLIQGGFSGGRNTAAFNNPNQLGYYTLLMAALIILYSTKLQIITKLTFFSLFLGLILVFSSLSKAAILSYVGLIGFYGLSKIISRKNAKKMLLFFLIIIGVYFLIDSTTDFFDNNILFQSVENRISSIGQDNDDSLSGRGYSRISDYPEYWIFGAGEGVYQRFFDPLQGFEFHSTLGNIQVSYGVVGLIQFLLTLYNGLRLTRYRFFYIIFPILLYGLTHNGIRNTFFWILIGTIGSIIYEGDRNEEY